MPGTSFESDSDFDPQDQAEAFDESMTVGGEGDVSLGFESPVTPAEDMRAFEEMPDVYDVTTRVGDRDEEEEVALDADEFTEDAIDDEDLEEDNELAYSASDEEHEDDLDGLGDEPGADGFDEDQLSATDIDGLDEVRDGDEVSGGEDDFTNFQARNVADEDLKRMGYSETRDGQTLAKGDGK